MERNDFYSILEKEASWYILDMKVNVFCLLCFLGNFLNQSSSSIHLTFTNSSSSHYQASHSLITTFVEAKESIQGALTSLSISFIITTLGHCYH